MQQDRQNRKRIKKGNTVRTIAQEVSRKAAKELYKKKQHKKLYKKGSTRIMQDRQHRKRIKKGNTKSTIA
jgi:hypothetical protein